MYNMIEHKWLWLCYFRASLSYLQKERVFYMASFMLDHHLSTVTQNGQTKHSISIGRFSLLYLLHLEGDGEAKGYSVGCNL